MTAFSLSDPEGLVTTTSAVPGRHVADESIGADGATNVRAVGTVVTLAD